MGIRPTFYLLIGIDDAKPDDPRRFVVDEDFLEDILNYRLLKEDEFWKSEDGFFDDYHFHEIGVPGFSGDIHTLIYNPELSGEYRLENVIGFIKYVGPHDDWVIRALCTFDKSYLNSGYKRIPTLKREGHEMLYRHYKYTERDLECNRFVDSVLESSASYSRTEWQRAMHYLKLVGWDIPEEDLRYLFVWNWS